MPGRRGNVVYSIFQDKGGGLWHEIPVMSGLLAAHNGVMREMPRELFKNIGNKAINLDG
jgi:hypothetical protein